jgi:hypothetical protein
MPFLHAAVESQQIGFVLNWLSDVEYFDTLQALPPGTSSDRSFSKIDGAFPSERFFPEVSLRLGLPSPVH